MVVPACYCCLTTAYNLSVAGSRASSAVGPAAALPTAAASTGTSSVRRPGQRANEHILTRRRARAGLYAGRADQRPGASGQRREGGAHRRPANRAVDVPGQLAPGRVERASVV